MAVENWNRIFSLSNRESYLNRILDKMSNGSSVSKREEGFLKSYDSIGESELQDFSHLSKNDVVFKMETIMSNGKKIMCEIFDRNGKIDDEIVDVRNDFESETSVLVTKHGDKVKIFDRFFYNLEYRFENDTFYLYQGEEFVEKIKVSNDEN